MKTSLRCLFVAVIVMMFCLPVTAFAKPHHSNGGRHHFNHNNHASHYVQQCGMSDSQFAYFEQSVKDAFFESERIELVKSAAATNSFTVSQVIRIMNIMDFESYKIDTAVIMYHSVCDYNNWYMVYSALTYSSSTEELNERLGL